MELPAALREAVDRALEGVALSDLARASAALSQRYRAEIRDGRLHVADDLAAQAYLATRLPATYAAIRASLEAVAARCPDFAPRTMLDVGAGPGSALWAAGTCWPGIARADMVEASPAMRRWGEQFAVAAPVPQVSWRAADVATEADYGRHDLVTLAYVLDELAPEIRDRVVLRLWEASADMLVIVEPGTPAGWRRILAARSLLIAAGAHLVAPCPHAAACPLIEPDWCHFARRVARSRLHRLSKDADVPWEDEKFIYLAAARRPPEPAASRVLAPPRTGSGRVTLKLCRPDGTATERFFSRREGAAYKAARRAGWGDTCAED